MKLTPIVSKTQSPGHAKPKFMLGSVLEVTLNSQNSNCYWLLLALADGRLACLEAEQLKKPSPGQQLRVTCCEYDRQNPSLKAQYWQPLPQHLPLNFLARLYAQCPDARLLDRLWQVLASVPDATLRCWLLGVFSDAEFSLGFVRLPASYNHHHSAPGGLLKHSLECAEWVGKIANTTLPAQEAGLVMTAALLHDAGKVAAYTSGNQPAVCHGVLTLTVLEPALRRLEQRWPQGAAALRQMLSWPLTREPFPRLPGSVLVRLADQYSTALSARRLAFRATPARYQWARLKTSTGHQRFDRVLPFPEVSHGK